MAGIILNDDYHSEVSEDLLKKLSTKMQRIIFWLDGIKHNILQTQELPKE